PEPRVILAALDNAQLTESEIVKALALQNSPAAFVEAVCHHCKWSLRREVRIALLRNESTPLAFALKFAGELPRSIALDALDPSHPPPNIKSHLQRELEVPAE